MKRFLYIPSIIFIALLSLTGCFSEKEYSFSDLFDYSISLNESFDFELTIEKYKGDVYMFDEVTIPQSIEVHEKMADIVAISKYAFDDCTYLETINISYVLIDIDSEALANNHSIKTLNVDEENPNYTSVDGNIYDKDVQTFLISAKAQEEVIIPQTVNTIESFAFYNQTTLKKITLPSNLKKIGFYTFAKCINLESIFIPKSTYSIGLRAFEDCNSLTIYVESSAKPYYWYDSWNISNCPVVWSATSQN